jgi:hypothetical protein
VVDDLVLVLRAGRVLGPDGTRTKTSQAQRFAELVIDAFSDARNR